MKAFEAEFASYLNTDVEAVAVNSATAGLHLVLEALEIGAGDEVIVPTWTFTATAEVVRHVGATPVIVDVDADTLNISMDAIEAALTDRTRAVIPVHMAGLPVDLLEIRRIIRNHDVRIIEDAAHALPAVGSTGFVGSATHSEAAVFSFYATKTLTTGEGGMITTRNRSVSSRARKMRLHGIDRDAFDRYASRRPKWRYDVVAPGYKYNMPDTAAAMGRVQLAKANQMHERRFRISQYYMSSFGDLPLRLPSEGPPGHVHAWHLFIVRLLPHAAIGRDEFIERMSEAGIGTSVHFIPLHEHTYWKSFLSDAHRQLPISVGQEPLAVSLPIYSRMTDNQVERVVETVRRILK